jgi:hypothetical protein
LWKKKKQQQQQQQNLAFEVSRKIYFSCTKNLTAFNEVMGDVIVLGKMIIDFMALVVLVCFALGRNNTYRLYVYQRTLQISYFVLCFCPNSNGGVRAARFIK